MTATVLRLLASLMIAAFVGAAGAQQTIETPEFEVTSGQLVTAILTVDIDRLFTQSQFGQRVTQSYATQREALATENRRIADALREEEIALAAQRSEMAVDVFRTEAEDFDEKAQSIRRAQDAKERGLEDTLAQGRDQFLVVTRPVLGQLMVDRGAFAILDRRSVLLSLGSIDVTDDAIARIDATIGDGAGTAQEIGPDLAPDTAFEN
ncbi:putative outer membrane protein [Octadecabacter antarcticus 307]|uniref:Putative outer membrane protein n=1 Tax=Octadecabacter antarcticus 307 TaxID=391626 RepID=M9RDX4_9RHOB|nr:OmpH family outer membrane protein [Octadecabacter antarcticus]AGI67990.1 putative outer membrane protein [Octadecabacter antarcticus 307]